ncbi:MAG: helix-hairpin-helix domain-containing protein [Candidatus Desantisbacteria bacterium]
MNKQYGIALILTLWLVLALAAMASVFVSLIRLEAKAVNNQKFVASALALAEAGVVHATVLLKNDTNGFDSLDDEWAKPIEEQLGEGTYSVTIVDEESKVNINYASGTIMVKLGLSQDIAREIIQYRKNNGLLDTVAELLSINGMDTNSYCLIKDSFTTWSEININLADKDVLAALMTGFGVDADKAEKLADELIGKQPFTNIDNLSEIVGSETCQILKLIVTTAGGINVNTASEPILSAYGIDPEIIQSRTISEENHGILTTSSKYFNVTATGNSHGVCKTIHAVLHRTQKDKTWEIRVVYWLEDE